MIESKAQRYKDFVSKSENSMNCLECPMNEGHDEWPGHCLPCGQFHCWVDVEGTDANSN